MTIAEWYTHMDQTLLVMLDRSMWFAPIHEAIVADNMRALSSRDARLIGREKEMSQPVLFACGYAQVVFLCTAFEVYLIHHYINSLMFFAESGRGTIKQLQVLEEWVDSRREFQSWEDWQKLSPVARARSLWSLPFADLRRAETLPKFTARTVSALWRPLGLSGFRQ